MGKVNARTALIDEGVCTNREKWAIARLEESWVHKSLDTGKDAARL